MDEESEIEATYPGKFVCADCFDDDYLKAFIEDNLASKKCSYCGKESLRRKSAAPVDAVIERGCPSSDDLRHIAGFQKGGSGSSVIEIKRHAVDAASAGLRLSGA